MQGVERGLWMSHVGGCLLFPSNLPFPFLSLPEQQSLGRTWFASSFFLIPSLALLPLRLGSGLGLVKDENS